MTSDTSTTSISPQLVRPMLGPIAIALATSVSTFGCMDPDDPYDDPSFRAEADPGGGDADDELPTDEDRAQYPLESPYPNPSPVYEDLPCEATHLPEDCPPDDAGGGDEPAPDDPAPDDPPRDGDQAEGSGCSMGLAPLIYANPGAWAGTQGTLSPLSAGMYAFQGNESSPHAQNWLVSTPNNAGLWVVRATQASTSLVYSPLVGGTSVLAEIRAPNGAQPGAQHTLHLELLNILAQEVCEDWVTLRVPMDCTPQVSWWTGGTIPASYDGANCFITTPPAGTNPFVWNNQYYVTPSPGMTCPLGSYDGANCYIQAAPPNAFIYDNSFYTTPNPGPSCPAGSSYDTANCYWFSAPWGTTAFEYAGNWYTTPIPNCAVGNYDGANCWMGIAPPGTQAFVWSGNFYYAN